MSQLRYGNVALTPLHTREIRREVVRTRDNQDYVATRHIFDVDCVFNPAATAYRGTSFLGVATPVTSPGGSAQVTDEALRHYLSQPRRRLVYVSGGRTLLQTPLPGMACDVKGGPYPEVFSITQNLGDKTFLVSLRIIAYTTECPPSGGRLPILLAHRWRRWVESDESQLVRIITEGEAHFRLDELIRRDSVPDQYRPELFHPQRAGINRKIDSIIPTEDGSGLFYRVTDSEAVSGWGTENNGIYRLQAVQKTNITHPAPWMKIAQQLPSALFSGGAQGAAGGPAGAVLGGLLGGISTAISGFTSSFPTAITTCNVKAWGMKDTLRERLQNFALAVCVARVGLGRQHVGAFVDITHDLADNFVEVNLSHMRMAANLGELYASLRLSVPSLPAVVPAALGGGGPDTATNVAARSFPGQNTGGFAGLGTLITFQPGASDRIMPPNQQGTRGFWLGRLFAQGLQDACSLPDRPAALNVENYGEDELSVTLSGA